MDFDRIYAHARFVCSCKGFEYFSQRSPAAKILSNEDLRELDAQYGETFGHAEIQKAFETRTCTC